MLHNLFYSPDFPTTFPSCPAFQHWSVQLQKLLNNDAVSYHNPLVDPLWHKHFSLRFHVGPEIGLILASCWHWLFLCTFHNCVGFPKILRDCKRKITIFSNFQSRLQDVHLLAYSRLKNWLSRFGRILLSNFTAILALIDIFEEHRLVQRDHIMQQGIGNFAYTGRVKTRLQRSHASHN